LNDPESLSLEFLDCESAIKHFVAARNSSALTSTLLERQVTELTNYRETCSIRAGSAVIGQNIQWGTSDPAVMWGKERLEIELC